MNGDSDSVTGVRRPVAIDLYAGAGGLSLGLEQAGFDVIAAAELDPIHSLTHRYNFSKTPVLCADLTAVEGHELRRVAQGGWELAGNTGDVEIDAVVGGPPCQGFSVGGVRDIRDARNAQLFNFVRLVIALRPKVFCLKNVAGLLEGRFDELRADALRRLQDEGGYRVGGVKEVVNAVDYGVPQSRRRVLIFGSRDDLPVPNLTPCTEPPVTVGDALGGLPSIASYYRLLFADNVELNPADYLALMSTESSYARRLVGIDRDATDLGFKRLHDGHRLTNSLRTVHAAKTIQRFRRTDPGGVEPKSRLYRLSEEGVSRTLRAGTGTDRGSHTSPRPIHPYKARVITVREAARLHGYPDWFRFHATNWHGHRQVGNSVPPPLAKAAGRALALALQANPEPPTSDPQPLGDPVWLTLSHAEALIKVHEREDALQAV